MLKTLRDEPAVAGLSMHSTETRSGLVIHKRCCTASLVRSDSGQVETGDNLMLSLLHLQGLEVTVHKAILQLCLETLETGKLLLFLHGLMQFVSIWKTICSYMVSMWKRPVLPTNLLTCHENLFPSSYNPMIQFL